MQISLREFINACTAKEAEDANKRFRLADFNRRKLEEAERERLRRLKNAEDLLARQKAQREKLAREKAEKARLLAEEREAQRLLWEEARRQSACKSLKKSWGEDAYVDNQGRTHSKKARYQKVRQRLNPNGSNFDSKMEDYKYGGCFQDTNLGWDY